MKVTKIEIYNYRSIEEITIDTKCRADRKCSIFLGINESGKSNILKAIALLDKNHLDRVNYSIDCYKKAENTGEYMGIMYHLEFDGANFFRNKLIEKGYPEEIVTKIKIKQMYRLITVDDDNEKYDSLEIQLEEDPIFSGYLINEGKIQKKKDVYSGEEALTKENVVQLVGPNVVLLTKESLAISIEKDLSPLVLPLTPKVIFWEYDEKYLINHEIDLNEFAKDQNISIPLRNIFHIAKIENISERITRISASIDKRRQLEEELTAAITGYINQVWKEHKINVKVCIENMQCSIMIEDKDDTSPKYSISQRSDGFKQFMSILLNLSAENSTDKLKNRIILLDEPEVHLHPSGVRYLRDELLKISEKNIVLVATHSIYMVDRENLERHYKVEKDKSVTKVTPIPEDNPYMDEVVYEALGTSIYELIEPNMLVFEGKTDKDLFDAFTKKYKVEIKPKKIGTISADGVEKMPKYTKFFNGKMVKGYFVTDSDAKGKEYKKQMIENEDGKHKDNIFEINDILDQKKPATLEDLLPIEVIQTCLSSMFNVSLELNPAFPYLEQVEKKNKELKGVINLESLKGELTNRVLKEISSLNKKDCEAKYALYLNFVKVLNKKIK